MFAMSVYGDGADAVVSSRRLRDVFPDAKIDVVFDGSAPASAEPNEQIAAQLAGLSVEIVHGERVKVPGSGGAYLHRFFERLLQSRAEYLIKVDPDTVAHRRFTHFPAAAAFFGTVLERGTALEHVQGGCVGLRRDACRRLVDAGISLDPIYREPKSWCEDPDLLRRVELYEARRGALCTDFMLVHMLRRIGVPPVRWWDVRSLWHHRPRSARLYALSHPARSPSAGRTF